MTNVINRFEIPAVDFARAEKFYAELLNVEKEDFVPTTGGPIIYLNGGNDLGIPLSRVEGAGGKITIPKTRIEKMFMAEY